MLAVTVGVVSPYAAVTRFYYVAVWRALDGYENGGLHPVDLINMARENPAEETLSL